MAAVNDVDDNNDDVERGVMTMLMIMMMRISVVVMKAERVPMSTMLVTLLPILRLLPKEEK